MAHIAAVLPHLKNAGAVTHDHASDASDGDFAAVLASLTPKTDVPDAKPHAAAPHPVAPEPQAPGIEIRKTAPKIALHVAPPAPKGEPKIPAQLKSHAPDKPDAGPPQPSEDVEDKDASVVAPVRPLPQPRLIDKTAPEIDPDTGHPVATAEPAAKVLPDIASHASLAAPPVPPEQDRVASNAAPARHDTPAPTGAKVAQQVVDKIVAEAKTPPSAVDVAKLAGKPEPNIQAAVARAPANVVVIDKTPLPPQVAVKAAPQTKPDVQAQPRAEQPISEPDTAAPQAPAAPSDTSAQRPDMPAQPDAPAQQPEVAAQPDRSVQPEVAAQPDAPAQQSGAPAPAAAAVVAIHPQIPSAPQIATAAAQHPAAPEPQLPQPNVAALAAAIAAKSGQGSKMFEIRLDPPELGRVDVHLSVSHDGKAQATLYADRPETVALLRGDSQNLERALKDAGLELSNSSLNFSLKGEQRQGDGGGASQAHTRNLSHAVVARSEAVNASLANQTQASADGRLDIRV